MIDNMGHFLLKFLGKIWTEWTLRHILGPILVNFDICHNSNFVWLYWERLLLVAVGKSIFGMRLEGRHRGVTKSFEIKFFI